MVAYLDPTKQAQEVLFLKKLHSSKHPDLYFNNLVVVMYFNHLVIEKVKIQELSGLKLDKKLNSREHLKGKFVIVNK